MGSRRKPPRRIRNEERSEAPVWASFADLAPSLLAIVFLVLGLGLVGGLTGFRLFDG